MGYAFPPGIIPIGNSQSDTRRAICVVIAGRNAFYRGYSAPNRVSLMTAHVPSIITLRVEAEWVSKSEVASTITQGNITVRSECLP